MREQATYAVIGTDTEVGKTVVGCGLSKALVDMGHPTIAIKPVETGCRAVPVGAEDGVRLASATGQQMPTHALRRFVTPVAPPVAADLEGESLEYDALIQSIRDAMHPDHIHLIEGAGGLLSPITWSTTMIEICQDLGAQAILVASDKLGVLNHTRMTVRILEHAKIPIAAIVLCRAEHPAPRPPHELKPHSIDASVGRNLDALRRLVGPEDVIYLPYLADTKEAAKVLQPLAAQLAG
ncbi:MAG: dethiobiotin synthase [Myxococcota bacterium]|nr:dethiobiotin synthase [Myxococcota bacterium]